jgi:lysophospholipid hydrolase
VDAGCRGAAHVGVIKAMREHGIPVDIVGGTSIGSMIGGLYCESPEAQLAPRARSWFMVPFPIKEVVHYNRSVFR